jgi:predicted PurR-regulated permease PerM
MPTQSRAGGAPAAPIPEPPPPPLRDIARRVTVVVLVTLLILALAYVVWRGAHILLQTFAGILFAVFLSALAGHVRRYTRLSYGWSLAVVLAALFVLAGLTGWLLTDRLAGQVAELAHELPRSLNAIKDHVKQYEWGEQLLQRMPSARTLTSQASEFSRLTGFISGVASFLVAALVILFVGIFGAAEPGLYRVGLLHLIPLAYRPRAAEALDAVAFNLRCWLLGQVFLMFVIGATTALGLWLLGVPLALTLGVIAGIFEMVPYVGPWLSAVPAALIALLVSPLHMVAVLGLFLFLHILEGYVLLPLVQRRAVHLPPALTLVGQVLLGELLGFLGLFVAAPLTVTVVVLLKMLYVEDTLGDRAVDVPGEPGNKDKPAVQAELAKGGVP